MLDQYNIVILEIVLSGKSIINTILKNIINYTFFCNKDNFINIHALIFNINSYFNFVFIICSFTPLKMSQTGKSISPTPVTELTSNPRGRLHKLNIESIT